MSSKKSKPATKFSDIVGLLEAKPMPSGLWAVLPKGQFGTLGFMPQPWQAQFVPAKNAKEAIQRGGPLVFKASASAKGRY